MNAVKRNVIRIASLGPSSTHSEQIGIPDMFNDAPIGSSTLPAPFPAW